MNPQRLCWYEAIISTSGTFVNGARRVSLRCTNRPCKARVDFGHLSKNMQELNRKVANALDKRLLLYYTTLHGQRRPAHEKENSTPSLGRALFVVLHVLKCKLKTENMHFKENLVVCISLGKCPRVFGCTAVQKGR